MLSSASLRHLRLLLLALLFLCGQWLALLHASEHPFHGEHETCAIYLSADHHSPALILPPPLAASSPGEATAPLARVVTAPVLFSPLFQARAPPRVL